MIIYDHKMITIDNFMRVSYIDYKPIKSGGRRVHMELERENVFRFRRIMLLADLLLLLLAGILYGWSVFVAPLEAEFGWVRSQTSLTYTIAVGANTLAGVGAAYLSKRLPRRKIVRIAAVCAFCGMLLASFTTSRWQLYLGYGVLFGAAAGMVYNSVLSTVVGWFPNIPTTISGFLLMSYGFSAAIFGPLSNLGIERFGWRVTFRALGMIALVIFAVCAQAVRHPTQEETALLPQPAQAKHVQAGQSLTPKQMLRQASFWLYACWTILMASVGMALSGHASPIAQSLNYTAAAAAMFAGLVSVCNGAGRLVFGAVYDRLGMKTLLVVPVMCIAGSALLMLACSAQISALLIPAFLLLGLSFGASPVCSTGFIKSTFGPEHYGMNLGLANLAVLVSAYVGPYVSGVLFERSGYSAVYLMMLGLAVGGGMMAIILLAQGKKRT